MRRRPEGSLARLLLAVTTLGACFYDWDGPLEDAGKGDSSADPDAAGDVHVTPPACDGAALCENFDEHSLEPTWETYQKLGTLRIDTGSDRSEPKLLRVVNPPQGSGDGAGTWVAKVVTKSASAFDLSFWVKPEVVEATNDTVRAVFAGLVISDGAPNERPIRMSLWRTHASIERKEQNGSYDSSQLKATLPPGKWTFVRMIVDPDGTPHVSFDGSSVYDGTPSPGWPVPSSATRVNIGVNFATTPHTEWRFVYDDVRLGAQ